MESYLGTILFLVVLYAGIAVSYDLVAGSGGMLPLSHMAIVGIGAYSVAIVMTRGYSYLVAVVVAATVAAVACAAFSFVTVRLRKDVWIAATLGLQLVLLDVGNNLSALTGGPLGTRAPPPSIAAPLGGVFSRVALVAVPVAMVVMIAYCISRSRFAMALRAAHENEVFVRLSGIRVGLARSTAFIISGTMAAVIGCGYGPALGYLKPETFALTESLLIMGIAVVGGLGTRLGPLLGAVALVGVPEFARLALSMPPGVEANLRKLFFGLFVLLVVIVRPRGLVRGYDLAQEVVEQ